jgi:hypothetical protein
MTAQALAKSGLALVRRLFTPLAVVFLAIAAYRSRETVAMILAQADLAPLLFTVVAWALLNLLVPAISRCWLGGMETPPRYRTLLEIHLKRLPARYLPGGIWHTVSRVADLHDRGLDRAQLAALVLLENAAPLAVALLLGGLCALAASQHAAAAWVAVIAGLSLIALLPLLRRRLFPQARAPGPAQQGLAYALVLLFWGIASSAFVMYWSAFPTVWADGGTVEVLAAYLLGWSAGFLAIIAPQGIGVFETVAAWQLKGSLPFAGIAVLLAGFRAATLAGDALAYVLAVVWRSIEGTAGRSVH